MSAPRLWLTSTSADASAENPTEMVSPLLPWLDGVVWVLNDVDPNAPAAAYLEAVKGAGRVIHRPWPKGRHNVAMNDALYCGPIEEGDFVLYADALERPMPPFVARVKAEIGPMMVEADLDVVAYYGKAFLLRYRETMEYRGSPHWYLTGHNGRAIEWSTIEPNEKQVRFNARPLKRPDPLGWVLHYAKYHLYPAGCNHALLGLEKQGDPNVLFPVREARRLAFRQLMRQRGYPLTVAGLKEMLTDPLDDEVKNHLRGEKTLSDAYWLWHGRGAELKDTHLPSDALPIL